MKTLYLRIYLTVVVVLLLFALVSTWVFQRNVESARAEVREVWHERLAFWTEMAQNSLPDAAAPLAEQRDALHALADRIQLPLALDDAAGERIAMSELFARHEGNARAGHGAGPRAVSLPLADGRTLWVMRPGPLRGGGLRSAPPPLGVGLPLPPGDPSMMPPPPGEGLGMPPHPPGGMGWLGVPGVGLVATLAVLFAAISIGAYPVVRRLTRRLESLKQGVEAFGAGALGRRVAEDGNDEVAAVATSFNRAAERIEALVRSHQSLLANASHELRSPLARMKMALALFEDAPAAQRDQWRREIDTNIAELDALVEEVLLASRLDDAAQMLAPFEPVDLLALAAEEAARVGALVEGEAVVVSVDERLIRRALRNLLENARRYGGSGLSVKTQRRDGRAEVSVCDRGPGVPDEARERIFEPFYRLPGHAEQAGGVGLGLSLVKQIAARHGGSVHCEAREGGGSCFVLSLPGA